MDKIIVQPFIKVLKTLVAYNADPNSQVTKLKMFRDEEKKKKLLLAEVGDGIDQKLEKEGVKKRAEMKMDYMGRRPMAKKSA